MQKLQTRVRRFIPKNPPKNQDYGFYGKKNVRQSKACVDIDGVEGRGERSSEQTACTNVQQINNL